MLADDACDGVGGAARGERHDDGDRLARISRTLRICRRAQQCHTGGDQSAKQIAHASFLPVASARCLLVAGRPLVGADLDVVRTLANMAAAVDHHGRVPSDDVVAAMIPMCAAPREASPPRIPLPPYACDTHAHVFGPAARFPYAGDRSYTPPDAPLAMYLRMLDTLGFARGVLVQGSAHGRDNSAMLDALVHHPDRLRAVAVADEAVPAAELRRWASLGVHGLRFNHFFRDGQLHYRGGVTL